MASRYLTFPRPNGSNRPPAVARISRSWRARAGSQYGNRRCALEPWPGSRPDHPAWLWKGVNRALWAWHKSKAPGQSPSNFTFATPLARNPNASAAALERSMIRLSSTGPRSLILTVIVRPFPTLVTRTFAPSGKVRWAAVIALGSKSSPLAVRCPANARPYHEAKPTCVKVVGARWVTGAHAPSKQTTASATARLSTRWPRTAPSPPVSTPPPKNLSSTVYLYRSARLRRC